MGLILNFNKGIAVMAFEVSLFGPANSSITLQMVIGLVGSLGHRAAEVSVDIHLSIPAGPVKLHNGGCMATSAAT